MTDYENINKSISHERNEVIHDCLLLKVFLTATLLQATLVAVVLIKSLFDSNVYSHSQPVTKRILVSRPKTRAKSDDVDDLKTILKAHIFQDLT